MKKIFLFFLFLLLFVASVYIGYTLFKSDNTKNVTINTALNEEKTTLIPTINTPQNTSSPQVVNDSQINLIISSPVSGVTIDAATVAIIGSTEPNASIVINDAEVTANKDGSFKTSITLDEGENYISIVAYNELGNVAEREIIITRTVSGI